MDTELFKSQLQAALNKGYFYLKFRARTEQEMRMYLNKKAERFHWPHKVVEKAIEELKEEKLIDDKAFVELFVHERSAHKQRSRFALQSELQRFGIHKDLITAYFDQNPVNEDDLALEALKKRWHRFEHFDKKVRFQKAASFLSRRGFSFDVIRKSITTLEDSR